MFNNYLNSNIAYTLAVVQKAPNPSVTLNIIITIIIIIIVLLIAVALFGDRK